MALTMAEILIVINIKLHLQFDIDRNSISHKKWISNQDIFLGNSEVATAWIMNKIAHLQVSFWVNEK